MIVSLSSLKLHLRVDGDEEDMLIEALSSAAEAQVSHWIGRPIYAAASELPPAGATGWHPRQLVADQDVHTAIKMLADRLYHDRAGDGGPDSDAVPPLSVRALLAGLRDFGPAEGEGFR